MYSQGGQQKKATKMEIWLFFSMRVSIEFHILTQVNRHPSEQETII